MYVPILFIASLVVVPVIFLTFMIKKVLCNVLFSDLDHASQYVQSLALCTLGNVGSTEMTRDLAPDVERLMRNSNAYIKKKVCYLCD